jgi:hypothetical protein
MNLKVWDDANFLIEYWESNGFKPKKAKQAALISCLLLIQNCTENKQHWVNIYNHLVKQYNRKYETKTEIN